MWTTIAPAGLGSLAQIGGVACAAASSCAGARVDSHATGGQVGAAMVSAHDGATWTPGRGLASVYTVTTLSCADAATCMAVGLRVTSAALIPSGSTVLVSEDGGSTWSQLAPPSLIAYLTDVSCAAPGACTAVGYGASAHDSVALGTTTDGGRSWLQSTLALSGQAPPQVACPTRLRCMVAGKSGIFATVDGGRRWTQEGVSQLPACEMAACSAAISRSAWGSTVACPTAETCFVGTNGDDAVSFAPTVVGTPSGLLATFDFGATWHYMPIPSSDEPLALACAGPSTCVVVLPSPPTESSVLVTWTDDSGREWARPRTIAAGTGAYGRRTRNARGVVAACDPAGDCIVLVPGRIPTLLFARPSRN
jgi:photosystem II stability/assembly factor-like uncharacterized protein